MKADKGTLFLDEIGDLEIDAQAMLLQVLEDRVFRAVGDSKEKRLNARLVLATHRNLEHLIEKGKFRQDLFARIYDLTLDAPPLRERRADIPLLVQHFITSFNEENPDHQVKIPPGALDCLFQSEWPENVRQLLKVVRKAAVFKDSDGNINVIHLKNEVSKPSHRRAHPALNSTPLSPLPGEAESASHQSANLPINSTPFNSTSDDTHSVVFDPATDSYHDAIRKMQRAYLKALLEQTHGNKERAIEISGLSKSQFYARVKELKINK